MNTKTKNCRCQSYDYDTTILDPKALAEIKRLRSDNAVLTRLLIETDLWNAAEIEEALREGMEKT